MDVLTIERDFTAWLAGQLGFAVDNGIYRGGIPEGIDKGVAVIFGAEEKARGFYGFRPRAWQVQIFAKFADRDDALRLQTTLNGMFPRPDFAFGDTRFITAAPRGSSEPYLAADNGETKVFVSYNLVLTVLTVGTQV